MQKILISLIIICLLVTYLLVDKRQLTLELLLLIDKPLHDDSGAKRFVSSSARIGELGQGYDCLFHYKTMAFINGFPGAEELSFVFFYLWRSFFKRQPQQDIHHLEELFKEEIQI